VCEATHELRFQEYTLQLSCFLKMLDSQIAI